MTKETKAEGNRLVVQEHCIDLPGESVQCWIGGGTDKLKVILRKHRDVIFDINLGNGQTYTLESTESDYYNARDKKLIYATRNGKVLFKDGERLHVWLSRGFRGALVLKIGDRILFRVEPEKWDANNHSGDPKEKPAPIIVALGQNIGIGSMPGRNSVLPQNNATVLPTSALTTPHAASSQIGDCSWPVVCVIDGKTEGMPADLAEYFAKGGDGSGLSEIDPWGVSTRNWIWGQIAGTGAYVKDNWGWLKASLDGKTHKGFQLVKAQIHYVRGKVRFYFSGYSNSNTVFGRGGFGPTHDRVLTIFAGTGKTESVFKSALKGIAGTFKTSALASFIFGSATAVAEWKNDVQKDGYDLAGGLITSALKAVLAAAIITLVVAVIIWFVMVVAGIALPVLVVGAMTLGVGILASYAIDATDKLIGRQVGNDPNDTDGTATIVAAWLRNASVSVQQNWNYLMKKMSTDYKEIAFEISKFH